jgi:hypothetical protein
MRHKIVVDKKKARACERAVELRRRKVQFVFDACPQIEGLETSPDPNKLPIGQLFSAARQFILKYFENCILNSAFAVEYGLILKIDADLTPEKKNLFAQKCRGGFSLSNALNMAKGNKWIDETLYNDLQVLKNLRDMSAHPSNWVTLYNQLCEQYHSEEVAQKWISKATNQSPKQIYERLKNEFDVEKAKKAFEAMASYADLRFGNLPDLKWATRKDTLAFQIDFVKKNSQPMVRELVNEKKIMDVIRNPNRAPKYILNRYNFPEEIAMKSLKIAFETLKKLEII